MVSLSAGGVLRPMSPLPWSLEHRSCRGDFFINWKIDPEAPDNVQPQLIPWREGSFSDNFSEWALYFHREWFFIRATLLKSSRVFGQLIEVPVARLQQKPMTPMCYGTLGCKLGIGTNFCTRSFVGFDVEIAPFVEIERLRQGVFFDSDKKSIYQSLIRAPKNLERLDKLWPSLFWDCVNVGVVGKLSRSPFGFFGGLAFMAKCQPQTVGKDLQFWVPLDDLPQKEKKSYQAGFSYQIGARLDLPFFSIGFGHNAYMLDADVLLKGLLVKQEGYNTIALGDGGVLKGTLVQKFSGHFLSLRCSF